MVSSFKTDSLLAQGYRLILIAFLLSALLPCFRDMITPMGSLDLRFTTLLHLY